MINNELFDEAFLSAPSCTIKRNKLYKNHDGYVVEYIPCENVTSEFFFPIGKIITGLKKYIYENYDLIIESAFEEKKITNKIIKSYAKVLYKSHIDNSITILKTINDDNEFEAIIGACNWVYENKKRKFHFESSNIEFMIKFVSKYENIDKIVKKYNKYEPVSTILVDEQNKEFLTNQFSFTENKWNGYDGFLNIGHLDQVDYKKNNEYFKKGVLKPGITIMIQKEGKDIYLTDQSTSMLGYVLDLETKKIDLTNESFSEEKNLDLKKVMNMIIVQKKARIETLINFKELFSTFSKLLLEYPDTEFFEYKNENLEQKVNKNGFVLVNSYLEPKHIVNEDENNNPIGYKLVF